MRLNDYEIKTIKKFIFDVFSESKIKIFGSRLINKKGGDIDIFVIPKNRENLFKKNKSKCKIRKFTF